MNYGQLKARIASTMHRSELLTTQVPNFVADATVRINNRLGLGLAPLVADDDTNPVLTDSYLLYLYAGLQAGYEFLNNGDNAEYYGRRFEATADIVNVTGNDASTDPYLAAGVPPFILGVN